MSADNIVGIGENAGNQLAQERMPLTGQKAEMMLNPFPNKPWFLPGLVLSLLKTLCGKGEIARNEQFLLFPQCLLTVRELSAIFIKCDIVVCKLPVWKSKKFVV